MTEQLNLTWLPSLESSKNLLAGGLAGAVSRTATSPLERLKILRQTNAAGTPKYDTMWGAFVRMYREEGFRGFFKGNGTNVIRIAPHSAVQFACHDKYKTLLSDGKQKATFIQSFIAGGLAGMTSSTLVYPLDLTRTILSMETTQYTGIRDVLTKLYAADGIRGLYKGWGATLIGIAPYVAINMSTFDMLKRHVLPNLHSDYTVLWQALLGGTAGGIAATLTYPTDLLRRRMQLRGKKSDIAEFNSTLECVRSIVKNEGWRGLFKGLVPCYVKVLPSCAISFMVFEQLKLIMNLDPSLKAPSG